MLLYRYALRFKIYNSYLTFNYIIINILSNQLYGQFDPLGELLQLSFLFTKKEVICMQNEKPFKTVDEQVEILKSRNLIFLDEHRAKEVLTFYGYYEIINGYKDHFMLNDDNDEYGFKKGMTFENIYALYQYDKNIRDGVRIVMENFEQNFKQVISNVVSSNISEMFNIYSAEENFNSGKVYRNHHTDRSNLIHKMNKIKCSNRQPFKYYMENHGNVPPWILCKGLTFGQTIYWFSLSKNEIKNKIISDMLGINTELIENFDDEFKIKQSFQICWSYF